MYFRKLQYRSSILVGEHNPYDTLTVSHVLVLMYFQIWPWPSQTDYGVHSALRRSTSAVRITSSFNKYGGQWSSVEHGFSRLLECARRTINYGCLRLLVAVARVFDNAVC